MEDITTIKVAGEALVLRCKMNDSEGDISFPDNTLFLVIEGAITWRDSRHLVTVGEREIVLIEQGMNLHYNRKYSESTGGFDALMIRLPDSFISDFRQRYKIKKSYSNSRSSYVMRSYSVCPTSMGVLMSLYPHFHAKISITPNIQTSNIELALLNIQHCNETLFNMIMSFSAMSQIDIVRYVEDNWEKVDSLEQLAIKSGNSMSKLERKFKAETGESIRSWVQKQQVEKSKGLLVKGLSVEAVSSKLGYTTPNAFIRAFKTIEGISPAKWRKQQ